ncbi:hypothetical protein VOLCADRAFT_94082 [Volvox carteri f. nagariensis]|uniref:Pherophorin domain-containing protein n=1 Tax=Volvox carteri f. nagariensis TaxID=3068 RepID=D8U3V5_VOLCA|nr:uncharacterized protein VOLCADRAFT_94082 [Volvox carteri f. nagariensis]EFJ45596.1 hypothetical protein VOLCADRAFT_94082 [Volvox carteri f. nagariensis]|eukprot:XP_002953286.1 hypothetical protein VOLCADRAFT_94082 [Volvox carteri f. nagariensis]
MPALFLLLVCGTVLHAVGAAASRLPPPSSPPKNKNIPPAALLTRPPLPSPPLSRPSPLPQLPPPPPPPPCKAFEVCAQLTLTVSDQTGNSTKLFLSPADCGAHSTIASRDLTAVLTTSGVNGSTAVRSECATSEGYMFRVCVSAGSAAPDQKQPSEATLRLLAEKWMLNAAIAVKSCTASMPATWSTYAMNTVVTDNSPPSGCLFPRANTRTSNLAITCTSFD